jgi:hypothetical protein
MNFDLIIIILKFKWFDQGHVMKYFNGIENKAILKFKHKNSTIIDYLPVIFTILYT